MWIEIDRPGIENFSGLIDASELDRIGKDPDYFGIGFTAALKRLPDSALVFKLDAEEDENGGIHPIADIRYFSVRQEVRNKGYFKALFEQFLKLISNKDIEAIRTDIPMGTEYNDACAVLEHYGFEFDFADLYEWTDSLSQCRKAERLLSKDERNDAKPLKGFKQGEVKEMFSDLIREGLISDDIELSREIKDYDDDISTVIAKDGKPLAMVLVKGPFADTLDLVYAGGEGSEDDIISALGIAMRAAAAKYKWNMRVHVKIMSETGGKLLHRIFPDARPLCVRRGYLLPDTGEEA